MIEQQGNMEDDFFEWLSERISASQQSELKSVYELISNFCVDRKIIKQPLLETLFMSAQKKYEIQFHIIIYLSLCIKANRKDVSGD